MLVLTESMVDQRPMHSVLASVVDESTVFVRWYVGGDDELVAMMIACCVRRLSSLGQAHAL